MTSTLPLYAVDLFAGGGGLTVGLKEGGFNVAVAVEVERHAVATYKANHPDVHVFKQDIRTIRGSDILEHVPGQHVHLLTGCPPCQGFTSLTKKHKNLDKERDALVLEMGRLVTELMPDAVLMENVPGLRSDQNRYFSSLLKTLQKLGYKAQWGVLQVADFGVPQSRRRLVLTAGLGFEIPLPDPTHSRTGNKGMPHWRTLRDAIAGMDEPMPLSKARARGGPTRLNWHVVRDVRPITTQRLAAIQPGDDRKALPDDLRPDCHKGTNDGFTNVYGRMSWDQTPVTITAGCLTASMGRFGHPDQPRTISLREAALIQTFPKDYVIDTEEVTAATAIVGNALPCDFAKVLAETCSSAILRECTRLPIRVDLV